MSHLEWFQRTAFFSRVHLAFCSLVSEVQRELPTACGDDERARHSGQSHHNLSLDSNLRTATGKADPLVSGLHDLFLEGR